MYRCQSAYKLLELDARYGLFAHSRTVLDLAAAPGGFAQVALQRMRHAARTAQQQHGDDNDSGSGGDRRARVTQQQQLQQTLHTDDDDDAVVIAVDQRRIAPLRGLYVVRANVLHHDAVLHACATRLSLLPRHCLPGTATPEVTTMTTTAVVAARADEDDGGDSSCCSSRRVRGVDVVLHDGVSVVPGQRGFSVTYAQCQMAMSALLLACKAFYALPPSSSLHAQSQQQQRMRASSHTTAAATALARTTAVRNSDKDTRRAHTHEQHGRAQRLDAADKTSSSSSSRYRRHAAATTTTADADDAAARATRGGVFVTKVMASSHLPRVEQAARACFVHVALHTPQACRRDSRETYLVARGFRRAAWQRYTHAHNNNDDNDMRVHDAQQRRPQQQYDGRCCRRHRCRDDGMRAATVLTRRVFSLPPSSRDAPPGQPLVWHCLGCGQTRIGCTPCMACT